MQHSRLLRCMLLGLGLVFGCALRQPANAQQKISRPGHYSGYTQIEFKQYDRKSLYLPMRDGVRLAVDVYLPRQVMKRWEAGETDLQQLPTVLYLTRYVRSLQLKWAYRWLRRYVTTSVPQEEIAFLVKRGYAVLVVDVRGCGASFGHRTMEWSPDEVKDFGEVCEWIVAQPWSNQKIGGTGVSYVGTTALHLPTVDHPAVKAIFPRSAIFDLYADLIAPGGIIQEPFIDIWGLTTQSLDNNNFDVFGKRARTFVKGINPVDDDPRGKLLQQALQEHERNFDIITGVDKVTFRDDGRVDVPITADTCSPHRACIRVRGGDVFHYWISGWYDGSILSSSPKGFKTLQEQSRLVLGPWDHGPVDNASPFRKSDRMNFNVLEEMWRYFDFYLKGIPNGFSEEPPVWYYVVGAEAWRTASDWPPPNAQPLKFYIAGDSVLAEDLSPQGGYYSYKPDYSFSTGHNSRYNSQTTLYKNGFTEHDSIGIQTRELFTLRSAPLRDSLTVAGHPILDLWVRSPTRDASLFVYIMEETAQGELHYVTEGMFRARHRKTQPSAEAPYWMPGPYHSYHSSDDQPLVPEKAARLQFDIFPIAYRFQKGSRIRIAIAGNDIEHFKQIENAPETLELLYGTEYPSSVQLPVLQGRARP